MATTSQQGVPSDSNSTFSTAQADPSTPSTNTPNTSGIAANSDTPNSQTARSNSTSASHLNPRSCVTCRRRKVRCNKENPCANCVRAGIECVFPGPGRAPRKSRKPPDAELLARLKKLEGVVTSLGAQVDDNGVVHSSKPDDQGQLTHSNSPESPAGNSSKQSIDKNLGRLVISEDRSRYVSNHFWASMGDEIAEMRDLLDAETSEDDFEDHESPDSKYDNHHGFLFGYSSLAVDLKSLHPSPSQIFILWECFKENVDPVVRILHRPTAKNILINAASSLDKVSKPAEALLFAIYFGAVVSLTEDQCRQLLDEEKSDLIKKYRFATEQALARADFLNSSSLMCLQAFIFFLIFVRHMDDSRLVWALSSLAIHLAQALGIHRDGSHFAITPFDTEMRRRLWWHISILDNRSSEDHGTDPTLSEQSYDTKLPLNINDDDISPEMQHPPTERVGATEMTFCLIRFELSVFSRRLNLTHPGINPNIPSPCNRSFADKEKMIDACHKKIEEKYLQHCDMNVPIYWVSATVARLILAKMWLMVHHPRSFMMDHDGQPLPSETKDRLFVTSIEVIEFSYLLERNENTARWGWLFRTYMQWQSVAFVLSEICARPPGVEVDRAWRAIESVYNDHFVKGGNVKNHKGMLWRPLRHLMTKAKLVRARQVRDGEAQPLPKSMVGFGRDSRSNTNSNTQSGSPGGSGEQRAPQFEYPNDQWASKIGSQQDVIGVMADALGLDFDFESLRSPHSSEGSTSNQQQQQRQIPRAMASVYGSSSSSNKPQQQQRQQTDEMQGILSHSPSLSISSDFGGGGGGQGTTTASDLGITNITADSYMRNNADMTLPTGTGMDGTAGMEGSGEFDFNSPDFLNWSGWTPGVGDFSVAPVGPPDFMMGGWNPNGGVGGMGSGAGGDGSGGGGAGGGGGGQQQQQQWY